MCIHLHLYVHKQSTYDMYACICVCVCVWVCMCMCMCTSSYTYTSRCVHICTCICLCIRIRICMYINTCIYIYILRIHLWLLFGEITLIQLSVHGCGSSTEGSLQQAEVSHRAKPQNSPKPRNLQLHLLEQLHGLQGEISLAAAQGSNR